MASWLLVTKSSPPSGGAQKKTKRSPRSCLVQLHCSQGAILLAECILLWAANPGAQRILVVGRWLVPGRELNPDLEVHNGTRYPTELSAHLAQLIWCWVNKTRHLKSTLLVPAQRTSFESGVEPQGKAITIFETKNCVHGHSGLCA